MSDELDKFRDKANWHCSFWEKSFWLYPKDGLCPICGKGFLRDTAKYLLHTFGSASDYAGLPRSSYYHRECFLVAREAYLSAVEATRTMCAQAVLDMLNKPKPKDDDDEDDDETDEG